MTKTPKIIMKADEDIRPGDVIVFLSEHHLISEIEPYDHPTVKTVGIARDASGWVITLVAGSRTRVVAS